ncbi:MAG: dioxygenase [Proteobacteria bacterium]|nr:dioxygenase [Pseudomonadota bacterium]
MPRLPVTFVSHGAPTHALEAGAAGKAWDALGQSLPRPQAVLAISPHWDTEAPMLSAAERPETIHDFYGFPEPLYAIRYPAPGAPALACRATSLLEAAGIRTAVHPNRGLDHGAWVPLRRMYPDADLPVTQLSTQWRKGPEHHYRLGQALAPLADEGVLVFGTGGITHNLREFFNDIPPGEAAPYVDEFRTWMLDRMRAGDIDALLDYSKRAPHAARAHPTDDHLMPLYVALGAAGGAPVERVHASVDRGVMAMDAYVFK